MYVALRIVAVHSQRVAVLAVDDPVGTGGVPLEGPDLCGAVAGIIGDDIGVGQGEIEAGGGEGDSGLETVAQIQRLRGDSGLVDAGADEVLHGGNVIRAIGGSDILIVFYIVANIKGGACLMASLNTLIQEVIKQCIRIGTVLRPEIRVVIRIINRIKDNVLHFSGEPISGSGSGLGGVLVLRSADIDDICILDGIGLFAHSAAVGGNGGRAGIALDGVDRSV